MAARRPWTRPDGPDRSRPRAGSARAVLVTRGLRCPSGPVQRSCLAALALALLALPRPARACRSHADCDGMLLCIAGECTAVACDRSRQCPEGRLCRDGFCRRAECVDPDDCPPDRECRGGFCTLLPPEGPGGRGDDSTPPARPIWRPWRLGAGLVFPSGLLLTLGLPLWDSGALDLGLGLPVTAAGLGWEARLRVSLVTLRPWLDLYGLVGLVGLHAGETPYGRGEAVGGAVAAGVLTGSGRFLFEPARVVNAAWAVAGLALEWAHGPGRSRLFGLDLSPSLLLVDEYRSEFSFPFWPAWSVRYGLRF